MYDDIRPYSNSEIPAAVARVAADPVFGTIVHYLFPEADIPQFRQEFLKIKTVQEFQERIMLKAIQSIIAKTSTGLTVEGFEKLDCSSRYMFVSNHRDILLDAAILQVILNQYGHDTSEITFGNNLMQGQFTIDIGKINKMFRIDRGGSLRNFYKKLLEISQYMRFTIIDKRQSVWIAQRNGRTKNGNDKTDTALLKMFATSSSKPFAKNLGELNITPLAVSYEYEPCDFLKTQELYISQYQPYVKAPGEDLHSIVQGITQSKGRIHIVATPTITAEEYAQCDDMDKNRRFANLTKLIDQRIHNGYRLWPTNYIAYDLIERKDRYADRYTDCDKKAFVEHMELGLCLLEGDHEELQRIFLDIYANPILNVIDNH